MTGVGSYRTKHPIGSYRLVLDASRKLLHAEEPALDGPSSAVREQRDPVPGTPQSQRNPMALTSTTGSTAASLPALCGYEAPLRRAKNRQKWERISPVLPRNFKIGSKSYAGERLEGAGSSQLSGPCGTRVLPVRTASLTGPTDWQPPAPRAPGAPPPFPGSGGTGSGWHLGVTCQQTDSPPAGQAHAHQHPPEPVRRDWHGTARRGRPGRPGRAGSAAAGAACETSY